MRIAICEFGRETNTFAKGLVTYSDILPAWIPADRLISVFRGSAQYLGGMIQAAEEEDVQLVPISSMRITASATIADAAMEQALSVICEELAQVKDSIDGICFAMHGAGCSETEFDMESYTLRKLRKVVGSEMPITASLDLHANLSQEMLQLSQGLFGIKENPHVDCAAAGYAACKALAGILRGELKPRTALIQLPLMITPATGSTYSDPMKSVKEYFAQYCQEHHLVDTTLFHGFSAADHENSSCSVLVIANDSDPYPHAKALANYFWNRRGEFIPHTLSPDEAIDQALALRKNGYVIINEISDNPGSGCPGDGTHLLRALLKRNLPNTVFQFIRDKEVAKQAKEAGVGARISICLGGKTDDMHGKPIELDGVEVVAVSDGRFEHSSPLYTGLWCYLGTTVRLRHGNVEFIVSTNLTQATDDGALRITGSYLERYQIVCLKSANHFRGFFESRADAIVTADPPGLRCSDLTTYPFKRIPRPMYPLDPDCEFHVE